MTTKHLLAGSLAGAVLLFGAVSCGDLLDVQDPSRYTSEDLDDALQAVTDGVEGDLHDVFSGYHDNTTLASDEAQHTGTWSGWDDMDHGRWLYDVGGASNGGLSQVRWFADDSKKRLIRVLGEADAMKSAGMAQIMTVKGWASLVDGENWCESVYEPSGPAQTDQQMLEHAKADLTAAMGVAQSGGHQHWYLTALAGRARANLWLGNYSEALADARAVISADPDFEYLAKYSNQGGGFYWVVVATYGENNAGGLREQWWPYWDEATLSLKDPYTGEPDPRMPVYFEAGLKGVDGKTDFYSQWKFQGREDDVPMTHSGEMWLIEAEVLWRQGNMTGAMNALNFLRTRAGLTPHAATTNSDLVFEYFWHEIFAELFWEARRFGYMHRLDMVEEVFGPIAQADDEWFLPRPTKFAISSGEAQYNPNLEDDAAARCLPMSGTTW